LLDDPSDYEGFARALNQVLANPELAEKMGLWARERVRERYLSLLSLYDYADLITELLEQGSLSSPVQRLTGPNQSAPRD
jgi:glycosyltransferase involved in cell wall biosynthesis